MGWSLKVCTLPDGMEPKSRQLVSLPLELMIGGFPSIVYHNSLLGSRFVQECNVQGGLC